MRILSESCGCSCRDSTGPNDFPHLYSSGTLKRGITRHVNGITNSKLLFRRLRKPTDRWQNQALRCIKEHWEDLFSFLCRSAAFLIGVKPKSEYTLLNSLNSGRYWSRENLYCKTSLRNFFLNRIKRRLVWKSISHGKMCRSQGSMSDE